MYNIAVLIGQDLKFNVARRFQALFQRLTTEDQRERINKALSPLM